MHRSHPFQRKVIIHYREHSFLHFSAVPSSTDNLHFLGQIEHYKHFRIKSVFFPIWIYRFGRIDHHKIWFSIILKIVMRRTNKHIHHKMSLPSHFCHEPYFQSCILVRTTIGIDNIDSVAGKVFGYNVF